MNQPSYQPRADRVTEMMLDLQTGRIMRETSENIMRRGNAIWAMQNGLGDALRALHRLDASPELKRALMCQDGVI